MNTLNCLKEVKLVENNKSTVIGTFMERDQAVKEIQRLHNLGYTKAQINVYSNPERAQTVERLMEIEVEGAKVPQNDVDEDTSWWDSIKDSFSFHAFHSEDGHQRTRIIEGRMREEESKHNNDMTQTVDLLAPYTQDLADGKLIIVVDNYNTP